ncbi:hypothetical protein Tco_0478461 [Tanacetum coccineum]
MAAVEVPQTLKYRGGQLNFAPILEVENFTNWKKRMPENQCTRDEKKAANLDQRLNSIIMPVLRGSTLQKQLNKLNVTNVARRVTLQEIVGQKLQFSTYLSPFQPKPLSSPQHKLELRPTKDFEAKYNKVKAKLALLSSRMKKKCHEMTMRWWKMKVVMALAEENDVVSKEGAKNSKWGQKGDLAFVKSSTDDTKVTISGVERPWLSKAEGFILPNRMIYRKLDGAEPIYGPKTIKSILRLKSTFKAKALKGFIINEPSSAPTKVNKSSSASKVHSAPAGKLKSVKIEDDPPLAIVMKELNNLKLQVSKNQSSYSRILFYKRCEKTDHRTCDHAEYISTMNMSQHLKSLGRASSRSKIPRPSKRFFPPCTHCGCIDHLSNECLYYPICGLCGSYDHDTNGHNRIISLEREINLRNPQHTFKRCEVCGSSTHTTTDHYDIEWFKRGEALQAKKAEALKSTRAESSNGTYPRLPLKVYIHNHKDHLGKFDEKAEDGYLLGYSLVSKAFRVFNTKRQKTKETYHITFYESPDAIKFSKPSVDDINIVETERYPPDEYLYPYEPS